MRVFTEHVGMGSATLTGYVLDHSDELLNARIRPAVLVLPGVNSQSITLFTQFQSTVVSNVGWLRSPPAL